MKNQILFLLASLAMAMGFSSCTSEDIQNPAELNSELVNFEISLPDSELKTRGYGDGGNVSNLVCYVYQKDAQQPMQTENVSIVNNGSKRGGSLGLNLPSSGAYDFVFLATAGIQNDKSASKVYYNPTERTLNLNYSKIQGNDEDVDCFFGVLKDISVTKGGSHKVTLKRPYAQLNIGTKDLTQYNTLASAHLQTVGVSVDGVYSSMNVMDGECVGTAGAVTLPASTLPSGQTFPAKDAEYLAMDYLLVKDRKNVTVSLTGSNSKTSFTSRYENIPLQRNYQTVVYGNLLTKENDFTVAINPEFSGSGDNEFETGVKEYDLIVKMDEKNKNINLNVIYYDDTEETMDLSPYIDSDNMIYVTFDELGLTRAKSINFYKSGSGAGMTDLIKCNINKLGVTTLASFFANNQKLINIEGTRDWDTSNITDMHNTFSGCTKLTTVNLSNWDTSKVTDMSHMFYDCRNMVDLNLSNWDTSNVTDMSYMFAGSTSMRVFDLNHFNTSNVTDMSYMFAGWQVGGNPMGANSYLISNWDTSKVVDMNHMFFGTQSQIPVPEIYDWNTSNVTDMSYMFMRSSFTEFDECNWDVSKVKTMRGMFDQCNIKEFINPGWNVSQVEDLSYLFYDCELLTKIDISNWNTSRTTNMSHMFSNCWALTDINVSNLDVSKVENMSFMFLQCKVIKTIDLSTWNTKNVTNMNGMFKQCFRLLDMYNNFDTSNVVSMSEMFSLCQYLYNNNSLHLSNWDVSKVENMSQMFYSCKNMRNFFDVNWNATNLRDVSEMFEYCSFITRIEIPSFKAPKISNISKFVYCCSRLEYLNITGFSKTFITDQTDAFVLSPYESYDFELIW